MRNTDKYFDITKTKKIILVDFDNTVVLDEWPYIGPDIEGASKVLKELSDNGHYLILYTQRSYRYPIQCQQLRDYAKEKNITTNYVDILSDAVQWFTKYNIPLMSVNRNKLWEDNSEDFGRKLYCDYVIDDRNVGMKYNIIINSNGEKCKVVDWDYIREFFVKEGLIN